MYADPDHWVQVEEIELAGGHSGEGPLQRLFAAVACSKRCAGEVLLAAAAAEEADRAEK